LKITALCMLALLSACGRTGPDAPAEGLAVRGAWIRAVPPSASMTAGYLTIENGGPGDAALLGAESGHFGMIQMHATVVVDGVARMRHQERVVVPEGGRVKFEPGGLHLMLMQPTDAIPASGTLPITLRFDGDRVLAVDAEVRTDPPN
jgi:copper(I)-binding protein